MKNNSDRLDMKNNSDRSIIQHRNIFFRRTRTYLAKTLTLRNWYIEEFQHKKEGKPKIIKFSRIKLRKMDIIFKKPYKDSRYRIAHTPQIRSIFLCKGQTSYKICFKDATLPQKDKSGQPSYHPILFCYLVKINLKALKCFPLVFMFL